MTGDAFCCGCSKILTGPLTWCGSFQQLAMVFHWYVLLAVFLGVAILPSSTLGKRRNMFQKLHTMLYRFVYCSACYNETIFLHPQAETIPTLYGMVIMFPPSAVYRLSTVTIDGRPSVWKGTALERL